jgi:hypothetical protein
MVNYFKKVEEAVDHLILPSLIAVFFIVVVGLFFQDLYAQFKTSLNLLDNIVIGIFVIDLGFKVYRATEWEGFLKEH